MNRIGFDARSKRSLLGSLRRSACCLGLGLALVGGPASWGAPDRGATYTFAFRDAAVAQVADVILGQTLGVNYTVEPGVGAKLTFRIDHRLTKEQLLKAFEQVLSAQGLVLVKQGDSIAITTRDRAKSASMVEAPGQGPHRAGYQTVAVPVTYATPSAVAKALAAITGSSDTVLYADDQAGLLVLGGTSDEIEAALGMIHMVDHSSFASAKMRWLELTQASASIVAEDLERILKASGSTEVAAVPLNRLNGILVFAHTNEQLDQVASWVAKLDTVTHDGANSLWSYHPRNLSAESLARVLDEVLLGDEPQSSSTANSQQASPPNFGGGLLPPNNSQLAAGTSAAASQPAAGLATRQNAGSDTADAVRIGVEKESNSLIIQCPAQKWLEIQRMLERIDQPPGQVLIEASILEVTLNNELKFGVDWSILGDAGRLAISSIPDNTVGVASQLPGFTATFLTKSIQVAVNTLGTRTNVDVVSSPKVIVLDNHTAKLNVGDEVPTVSQSAQNTTAPGSPIVNSINYQNTGVIMSVTPRITGDDKIFLDISEQVSSAIQTETSGIDSPTIQQREFDSSLVLHDGGTVALGGLISTNRTRNDSGIPYLKDAPWIGDLFKSKDNSEKRTELIVLISARIIKDQLSSDQATKKLRDDMREMERHGLFAN